MLYSDLVDRICELHPDLTEAEIARACRVIFRTIETALARGDRVELRGFGSFFVTERDARTVHNPKTGERIDKKAGRVPRFRAGKPLAERLREGR
jgi:integration host factor subunit beta